MRKLNESSKITLTIKQLKRLVMEAMEPVNEAGIAFGGEAYPKGGNVVILAGGAGSGKGFITSNVLLINGKTFDVDSIKPKLIKLGKFKPNSSLPTKFRNKYGYPLMDVDQSDPEQATDLHNFSQDDEHIYDRALDAFSSNYMLNPKDQLPNLIFDDPLRNVGKLVKFCKFAESVGYPKENIHLVWVVNSFEQATLNNVARGQQPGGRTAPMDTLRKTHEGAAETMRSIFNKSVDLKGLLDGDIWIVFSKAGVDTEIEGSTLTPHYLTKYTAYKMKEKKRPIKPFYEIASWVKDKIHRYIPKRVRRCWGTKV